MRIRERITQSARDAAEKHLATAVGIGSRDFNFAVEVGEHVAAEVLRVLRESSMSEKWWTIGADEKLCSLLSEIESGHQIDDQKEYLVGDDAHGGRGDLEPAAAPQLPHAEGWPSQDVGNDQQGRDAGSNPAPSASSDEKVLIAEALAALETGATRAQREEAFDKLRDHWFPRYPKIQTPSDVAETEPRPICGDCRYQQRDEHGGGRDDCGLRPENVPYERYRYGWDKTCSTFDDRGFREFKPNAETMDKIVDDLRAQIKIGCASLSSERIESRADTERSERIERS